MDDPLLTAVAEALREHGVTDPKAVIAAADAAERILGRDRCVCRQSVHAAHHRTRPSRRRAGAMPSRCQRADSCDESVI